MSGTLALPTSGTFSGLQEQTYINAALAALVTLNQGSSAPTAASTGLPSTSGVWWHDTANNLLKLRDQADTTWIVVASLDETNKQVLPLIGGGVATLASAATVDLGSVPQTAITVSGTTAITSFGTSMLPGQIKLVTFSGALTLTYNATSLILPGAANVVTAAGDIALVECIASGNFRVLYQRASGQAVVATGTGPVAGTTRNLKASLAAAGSSVAFTADEIVTETVLGGTATKLASYAQTLNIAGTGAGGMDTGTAPASGYVAIYAISGTAGTSILACNATTSSGTIYSGANMPTGYTASALIGLWPTNATPQLVAGLITPDRQFNYQSAVSIFTATTGPTTLTFQSISAGVPSKARTVDLIMATTANEGQFPVSVAADGNGLGAQIFNYLTSAGTVGFVPAGIPGSTYKGLVTFRAAPILTSQTIFWIDGGGNNDSMYVIGYGW